MLMKNAITASENANCVDFTGCNSIIPLFHIREHKAPPTNNENQDDSTSDEINAMCEQLGTSNSLLMCFFTLLGT
jgi:hypothetical protein